MFLIYAGSFFVSSAVVIVVVVVPLLKKASHRALNSVANTIILLGMKWLYKLQVKVCQGGKGKGVMCESPALVGSGESFFVSQLEDVPAVAESGGVRVAATVVLSPTTDSP